MVLAIRSSFDRPKEFSTYSANQIVLQYFEDVKNKSKLNMLEKKDLDRIKDMFMELWQESFRSTKE